MISNAILFAVLQPTIRGLVTVLREINQAGQDFKQEVPSIKTVKNPENIQGFPPPNCLAQKSSLQTGGCYSQPPGTTWTFLTFHKL